MSEHSNTDRDQLEQLIRGFQISQLIRLAAELDLASHIAPDAKIPIAQLALGHPARRKGVGRAGVI